MRARGFAGAVSLFVTLQYEKIVVVYVKKGDTGPYSGGLAVRAPFLGGC